MALPVQLCSRAGVYRAELLHALALTRAQAQAECDEAAALLGFAPCRAELPDALAPVQADAMPPFGAPHGLHPHAEVEAAAAAGPVPQARLWDVVGCTGPLEGEGEATAPAAGALRPLGDADFGPILGALPAPFEPLMPPRRMWPVLRNDVSHARPGAVDWAQLTRRIAQARLPRRLPRRLERHWAQTLWVVWDRADHLQPYAEDYRRVLVQLKRLRGSQGVVLWQVHGQPGALLGASAGARALKHDGRLPVPPPGAHVLVLSDLGALAAARPAALGEPPAGSEHAVSTGPGLHEARWASYLRAATAAGARASAWCPLADGQLGAGLPQPFLAHGLQAPRPGRRLRPGAAALPARQAEQARLWALCEALLVHASCAVHLAPPLLRALRLMVPSLRHEPALEALAWSAQPHVGESAHTRPLNAEAAERLRAKFKQLSVAQQQGVLQALWQHHATRARSTLNQELLLWQTHASEAAQAGLFADQGAGRSAAERADEGSEEWSAEPSAEGSAEWPAERSAEWARRMADCGQWWDRLAAQLGAGGALADAQAAQFARAVQARQGADALWWQSQARRLAPLWAAAGVQELPAGLPAGEAVRALARQRSVPVRECRLVQRGAALWLWPAAEALPARASRVGGAFATAAMAVQVPGQRARWHAAAQAPLVLVEDLASARPTSPSTSRSTSTPIPAPPVPAGGAAGEALQLHLDHATLALAPLSRPPWAHEFGRDRYGLYAELRVGKVTQRLRWIAAGEGWVGSTAEERERLIPKEHRRYYEDEFPRHRVRLSQGFWLADTACTQGLWLAVMGGANPSQFASDPERPVERLSHEDTERFLERLGRDLEGAEAILPTEAQWELACRAGTSEANSFGGEATHDRLNFDGAHQGTVSVKRYPPNAWGLYQMHGNVWEWCDDHSRPYPAVAVLDPVGHRDTGLRARRAVRGGSWGSEAWRCRSACRSAFQRGVRDGSLGFRFAIGPTSPAPPARLGIVAPQGPRKSAAASLQSILPDVEGEGLEVARGAQPRPDERGLLQRAKEVLFGRADQSTAKGRDRDSRIPTADRKTPVQELATRCPECLTVFRVVPDQLRVSAGWVRCGRCAEVFNASEHLIHTDSPEKGRPK